jgi:hypothetical protein
MTSYAPARHMETALDSHFRLFSVHERVCVVVLLVGGEEAAMLVGIAVARAARRVVSGRVSFMVGWLVRGVLCWFVVRGLEVTGGW